MQVARAQFMQSIALTGPTGVALKSLSDMCICAPGDSTAAIQERHLPIYHCLCAMLEGEFFD
jgi:D-sedoheptulose 7-phosphate isomerase